MIVISAHIAEGFRELEKRGSSMSVSKKRRMASESAPFKAVRTGGGLQKEEIMGLRRHWSTHHAKCSVLLKSGAPFG